MKDTPAEPSAICEQWNNDPLRCWNAMPASLNNEPHVRSLYKAAVYQKARADALTQSQRAEIERLRTALEFGIGLYDETHNARQQAQSLYEWVNVANAAITPQ